MFGSSQVQANRGIGGVPLPVARSPSTSFTDVLSGVAKIAGTVAPLITASGQVIQGNANAALLNQQAGILDQKAVLEGKMSAFEIAQQRKSDKAFRGKQLAQIGKSGIELEGTALDLVVQTAEEQEISILTRQFNSDQRKRQQRARGAVKRSEARAKRVSGFTKASSTLLNSNLFRAGIDTLKKA